MPSTLTFAIETDGGERRDLHAITIPDLPPSRGVGSRFFAESVAAHAASHVAQDLERITQTWDSAP